MASWSWFEVHEGRKWVPEDNIHPVYLYMDSLPTVKVCCLNYYMNSSSVDRHGIGNVFYRVVTQLSLLHRKKNRSEEEEEDQACNYCR